MSKLSPEEMAQLADPAGLRPDQQERFETLLKQQGLLLEQPTIRKAAARGETIPLSFEQRRLWIIDQLTNGTSAYNLPLAVRIKGPLDIGSVHRAITEIVRRHDVLRATFVTRQEEPVQVVQPPSAVPVGFVDLSGVGPGAREVLARHVLSAGAVWRFQLNRGPLLHCLLVRLGEDEHDLLITLHHIVSDDWSIGILVREFVAAYSALREGRRPNLPELPVQYADFALWQHSRVGSPEFQKQLAFWKQKLDGLPELMLAFAGPRPARTESPCGAQVWTLPSATATGLRALALRHGATPFIVFVAAFKMLLRHLAKQPNIVIGIDSAGRDVVETEPLIGFFVNQLVLSTDLSGDLSFTEILGRVRETCLEAYAHRDVPFERLVSESRVRRTWNHAPLFQIKVVQVQAIESELAIQGLSIEPIPTDLPPAKLDLMLEVAEGKDAITCTLKYNADIFNHSDISAIADQFRRLTDAVAQRPDLRLSELDSGLLAAPDTDGQWRALQKQAEWNRTLVQYPPPYLLHKLIEAQAAANPSATAVIAEDGQLTYDELNRKANRLARYLRSTGMRPGSVIAVYLDRSVDVGVTLLAILKNGCAYVPLDPDYPQERLGYMLEDSQSACVITSREMLSSLPQGECAILCLDRDYQAIALCDDTALDIPTDPADLAYIIYTSGSTGQPKGAMNTHQAVCNRLQWMQETFKLERGERVLHKTPLGFDVSVWEVFWPLLAGATLVMARRAGHRDISYLVQEIQDSRITTLHVVPSMLALLLDEADISRCESLTRVISSGESLSVEIVRRFGSRLTASLYNLYGPTEAAIDVTAWRCEPGSSDTTVPIGCPIANAEIYILSPSSDPVLPGVEGEIYIAGACLARGYYRRPGLTSEKFVPNPYSGIPGARMYRSGDFGRFRENGVIEFLGRRDDQVKIRGQRVELGEIESLLLAHPSISQAVVALRETAAAGKHFVAYVVPRAGAEVSSKELRAFLERRLPAYMVPNAFVPLTAMPLLPGGKINRRALPEPPPPVASGTKAMTAAEKTLTKIWADLLRVPNIGLHDNFFVFGGDSILSIKMASRARQVGLKIDPKQVFESPTIAELAEVANSVPRHFTSRQGAKKGAVPLTPIQRWFFEHSPPHPNHFNQSVILKTKPGLRGAILQQAVNYVVDHHDSFRLRFRRRRDGWEQFSAGGRTKDVFSRVELAASDRERPAGPVLAISTQLQKSLDLERPPLIRAVFFDAGEDTPGRLLIIAHHMVIDGVSWRILLEDLNTVVDQLSGGAAPALAEKTTSFRYWAGQLSEVAKSREMRAETEYWLDLCSRASREARSVEIGNTVEANTQKVLTLVDHAETRQLIEGLRRANAPLLWNDLLIAALARSLTKKYRARHLRIDLEGHGREQDLVGGDVSRTIGWFTTIVPLLVPVDTEAEPAAYAAAVGSYLKSLPRRGIGYGLCRYLSGDPQLSSALAQLPPAPVLFNFFGHLDEALDESKWFNWAQEQVGPGRDPHTPRIYPLEVDAIILDGLLSVSWSFDWRAGSEAEIRELAQDFLQQIRQIVIGSAKPPDARGQQPLSFPGLELEPQELEEYARRFARPTGENK